jgi:hypothetical protein
MLLRRGGMLENLACRAEQKRFVLRIVDEPAQLVREHADRHEVAFHAAEKRVRRDTRIA